MPNVVAAIPTVVTTPVAAFKRNPVVWLVALAIIAVLAIRYRDVIVGWFTRLPVAGGHVVAFTR